MEDQTISLLQSQMSSGEATSAAVTQAFLDRIERLDRYGPRLNSVIEVNPDAPDIARALDAERRAGRVRGPLHGIPILIKDNLDTADRMQTTAGSLALAGALARRDAFLVRRLRAAGAVLLGKTNLSEWANFRSTHSVSGWSSRGGLTRNPHSLDRSACGSSSGSAAAVAASFCAAALGTETDGSIICPAQTNGIVGFKPTLGLLSRSGIVPIAHSQDTAGPMARTVADVALLLGALTGIDPRDPATRLSRGHARRDYTRFLDPAGLKGARLGVARKMAGTDPHVLAVFEACLDVLRHQGAVLIDPADVPNYDAFGPSELEVLFYEFKAGLDAYLAGRGKSCQVHSLAEVMRFNEQNRERVMPFFGQERMETAAGKGPLSQRRYRQALARNHRLTRRQGIDAVVRRHRLDAVIVPSGGPAWLIDLANGDPRSWDLESTSPAAVAGYPHLTVPAGLVFGLPVGLSFFGPAWSEPALLRLGFAFEQATHHRRAPTFTPSLEIAAEAGRGDA